MLTPAPASAPEPATPAAAPKRAASEVQPHRAEPVSIVPAHLERVVIRPYPKTIFMYPLALVSLLCGILGVALPAMFGMDGTHAATLGVIFVLCFLFNVVVMSFEFTRHVSVALVLLVFVVILLGTLLNERVELLKFLKDEVFSRMNFRANPGFYFAITSAYVLCLFGIFFDTRTDYWEVRGNEVLHHHGFLGDVERYPAPSLKMRKEITDIFEYMLLLSGRLIIYPTGSERAIVLDNVPRINKVEAQIEELLDSLRVVVESDKAR